MCVPRYRRCQLTSLCVVLILAAADDIDSRSISEQKQATIEHWEKRFSSPDTQLYPTPPQKSPDVTPAKQAPTVAYADVIKSTDYSSDRKSALLDHESAIEREIRLAQEREAELKTQRAVLAREFETNNNNERELKVDTDYRETENRYKTVKTNNSTMPIHKLPNLTSPTQTQQQVHMTRAPVVSSSTPVKQQQVHVTQTEQEMTEVDRDALKRESIIEREIREQLAREEELRRQAEAKITSQHGNKVRDKFSWIKSCLVFLMTMCIRRMHLYLVGYVVHALFHEICMHVLFISISRSNFAAFVAMQVTSVTSDMFIGLSTDCSTRQIPYNQPSRGGMG